MAAVNNRAFWQERPVFVTGHTGFKGGWLTLWLHALGARVHGYALDPATQPNLFEAARIASLMDADVRADLSDLARLRAAVKAAHPSVVIHLAAQPLVRESYRDPVGTFATNVIGTAHVLEAARHAPSVRAVVIVTTDKVYAVRPGDAPYVEDHSLGGHDPYSASKAAAEIVTASFRSSFYDSNDRPAARVATVRAGNVIGGGDWAADRLIPDCLRAFGNGQAVSLRYPGAVRPWQHVLEPLSGYLCVAERLVGPDGARYAQAWNFGPVEGDNATVGAVARLTARAWGDDAAVVDDELDAHPHETATLRLDSSRAYRDLDWRPRWSLHHAVERTVGWHRAWLQGADMTAISLGQIAEYDAAVP